ncbi:MAG: HAD family hydrolase, partial [Sulfolobales archaeon]
SLRGLVESVRYVYAEKFLRSKFIDLDYLQFLKIYYRDDLASLLPNDIEIRWSFWENVWKRYTRTFSLQGSLFKCALDALAYLRGRGLIYVVTGREIRSCEMRDELNHLGIGELIHGLYTVGDFGKYTKKKDLFKFLVDKYEGLGFRRSHFVVISDSYRDLENASDLGVEVIGYVPYSLNLVKEIFEEKGFKYISSWCESKYLI